MMQRWSNQMTETLRTLMRRGVLLVCAGVAAIIVTISPLVAQPANAVGVGDFGFGGNSCAIETVGWVICPTMRSIARLADHGFQYINQSALRINYNLFGDNGNTFHGWEYMRNIANGLFVIVFLYMIYGYLVGKTNGNYSLKRLLPRLLVAVIAINLSYYIGVIFVDITNIIGDSVWTIMKTVYGSGSQVMPLSDNAGGVGGALNLGEGNLTKMTAATMGNGAIVWVLLPPITAVIITIATISAATVVLLIMRQVIVATLILVAPVLIVLYLLPNTERYFGQAMRLFTQLLLLYPIIAVLLGVGQMVSLASASGSDAVYGGGTMSVASDMVAAAAAVVPLIGVWFIFKNMSSIMSAAGSRLSATIGGSRGGKDDEKARVTGKATVGAANAKNATGLNNPLGRRQAFSRNRRHSSLTGSSMTGEGHTPTSRASLATPQSSEELGPQNVAQNALDAGLRVQDKETQEQLEALQNATSANSTTNNSVELEEKKGMGDTVATAVLGAKGRDNDKKDDGVTAKDLFNNMNRSHKSKDDDRKFGAGPGITGGGGQTTGSAAPAAPVASYRAPEIAQNSNIISSSSMSQAPVQVIAVPVQVDASSLLSHNTGAPPNNVTQLPISGTEEKAKARAQKYLFDAEQDLENDRNKQDILGHKDATPTEQPHTMAGHDRDDNE